MPESSRQNDGSGLNKRVQLAAQRAMRKATRYFGGYMSKIQFAGRLIKDMAKNACDALPSKLEGDTPLQQVHKAVFRCMAE